VNNEVLRAIVQAHPEIYGRQNTEPETLMAKFNSLSNVANWLNSGAKTVFLQDANTLIMRTPELIELLQYLTKTFPTIERITSYGRSKTAAKKSLDEFNKLHEARLARLHIGLESGCDEVLSDMKKGVTAEEHISGGKKVVESGISLSEYIMPGLGGKKWSQKHAIETATVLNQINPDFIRIRSLVVHNNSPLYDRFISGEFQALTEDEVVDEIRLLLENLSCNSYVVSDQMSNLIWEIEGQLPQDKGRMLNIIDNYKALAPMDRLNFRFQRRLHSYLSVYGSMTPELSEIMQHAFEAIKLESPEAEAKVDAAILSLKQGFI
jgi:radical SAM superfamily enzyme YgiQ (UPF0313 family)